MFKRSLAAMAALTLFSLAACSDDGGDKDDDTVAGDPSASATTDPSETADPSTPAETTPAAGACAYDADGTQPAKEVDPPPGDPKKKGLVHVTIETSAGDIKATLNAKKTPCTVNSFLSLADQDYFDDTSCHRVTTQGIYVLQCGDPTGTGMGGPGYQFDDELAGTEKYPAGTLAMANAGPGTNGSQFFMVYKDSSAALSPAYTVFGTFDTASIKLLQKVAAKGTDSGTADGAPKVPVTIDEVDD
ncbi:peptidylprolyl isomerase [Nocardioides sp. Soil796]|uniref:peptidylprolyl isomerase n=1 Tax=Nocardioides sp. Soil796 TaxID=1736412 RepID=UPI00070FE8D0|nr:peptidylprolyl isomerase [Nocardioides sp. Soil796]KRF18332.1 hypothetical protein ASH02_01880 [Nocardioides sp. Soil796]